MKIITLVVGALKTNCYLIYDEKTKETLILDAGEDADYIANTILQNRLKPIIIAATHGHFDHVLADYELQNIFKIPFFIQKNDVFLLKTMKKNAKFFLGINSDLPPKIDGFLEEVKPLKIGNSKLSIIFTSGHTPGSVCLLDKADKNIFVGDLFFKDGFLGRTDFKYSSHDLILQSLKKIYSGYQNFKAYPGHGDSLSLAKTHFAT